MIHCTVGIYANGKRKKNGVKSESLPGHIAYNLRYRPGRAFFVDGFCLNWAHLTYHEAFILEGELKLLTADKDTAPYV